MSTNRSFGLTALVLAVMVMPCWAQSDMFEQSESRLDSVLGMFGLARNAFEVDRIWAEDDTFLLPKVREALKSPFHALQVARDLTERLPLKVSDTSSLADLLRYAGGDCPTFVCADIDSQLAYAPSVAESPFEPMLSAFALAEGYRAQAFDSLTGDQRQALILAIPLWFEDEDQAADDSLKGALYRAFGIDPDTTQRVDSDSVLTLLALVNRDALAASIYSFARGLTAAIDLWSEIERPTPKRPISVEGVGGEVLAYKETPFGRFVIGGEGENSYRGDFALIVDLGGDDQYFDHSASALSGVGLSLSAIIDLEGNDHYEASTMIAQACGILGIGALIDLAGDDIYRSSSFGQAVAFCGAGLLFDQSGQDIYRAGIFAQGAAICGLALLADADTLDDVYHCGGFGQGFSSTFGLGALIDGGGDDSYRAGGIMTHAPLRPEDYRSLSQGFSIGARPRAGGGFGILHDYSGNDFYDAEIFAQGVGYWYSVGYLRDDSGNDAYNATQYSQGSGIHLAAGVLEDRAGDDRYGSRFGPGQGAAHDLSVGILYEHSGDDQYTISGGLGMAITNSAAVFLDAAGNDSYSTTEESFSPGGARPARGFGNLALFVDGEGRDSYSGPLGRDSTVWSRSIYGMGYDAPLDVERPREAAIEITLAPEDTQRTIEEIFDDAALWEVTDNREKVRRARMALIALGTRAVAWVAENKLDTRSGLERRAIIELFEEYPDSSLPHLKSAFENGNKDTRKNVLVLFGKLKPTSVTELLLDKLHDNEFTTLRPSILSVLGDIGDTTAAPMIVHFATSKIERERIASVRALGNLKHPPAYDAIFERLSDEPFTVRSAAAFAIAAQDEQVLPAIESRVEMREIESLEGMMLAVGMLAHRWSADEGLQKSVRKLMPIVRRYLEHPSPRVLGAAIVAASEVMNEKSFRKVQKRFSKSDEPVVRARLSQAALKYQSQ